MKIKPSRKKINSNPNTSSDTSSNKVEKLPQKLTLYTDSEFNQRLSGMLSLSIPVFCPELDDIYCVDMSEFSKEFDLISYILKAKGYRIGKIKKRELEDELNKLWKKKGYKSFTKKSKDSFTQDKLVKNEFTKLGLSIDKCEIEYSKKSKKLYISFKRIEVNFQFFFAYADLFRVFGRDCQIIWYERAKLTQFRTIKVMGKVKLTRLVDGVPTDFNITIFDNRYCFPPRKGSLDGQSQTFGVEKYLDELAKTTSNDEIKNLIARFKSKVKISELIESKFGDIVTEQWCKENMDIVRKKYPKIFEEYSKV
ncbi:MAG: hypothetical protein AAFX80_01710, partial [Cyanobacteria bacterium J06639_18]